VRNRFPRLALALLGIAALAIGAWWTWRQLSGDRAADAELARLEQALEGPGAFALLDADLGRLRPLLGDSASELESTLLGVVGLREARAAGELSRALLALSRQAGEVRLAAVLLGDFDAPALEAALGASASLRIEETQLAGRRVLYVERIDPETCRESRIGVAFDPRRIAVAEAQAIADLLERLGDAGLAGHGEADGKALLGLRATGRFELPEGMGDAAWRALFAELRAALGDSGRIRASARAERRARVGIELELDTAEPAGAALLARWAGALRLSPAEEGLRASARLESPATSLPRLVDAALVLAASAFQSAPSEASAVLEAWPPVFRESADLTGVPAYRSDAPLAGAADAIAGPFGVRIESVRGDGALELELRAVGPDLPNTPAPAESPRLVVEGVRGADGTDLLDARGCGDGRADRPQPLLRGSPAPLVEARKRLSLRRGAGLDAVGEIRGRVELDLAVRTQSALARELRAGQTLEVPGTSVELIETGRHGLAYRVRGDAQKLLHLRGLDAAGARLTGREAWQAALPGSGERIGALRFAGELAAVEAIFALERERGTWPFELESARPGSDGEAMHVESSSFIDYSAEQYDREFHSLRAQPRPWGERFRALAIAGPFQVGATALGRAERVAPQLTVIAPDIPNLTYNATGLELRLEQIALRERAPLAPGLRVPVAPGHRFGNLELEGEVELVTDVAADPADVERLAGQLVLRLPGSVEVLELTEIEPGRRVSAGRVSFALEELGRDAFALRMRGPLGRYFSARAFAEGERELGVKLIQVGEPAADGSRELRFRVQGVPRRIAIQLARGNAIRRYPFELTFPLAVPASPLS
jgi:hypothetical protein